MPRPIDLRSDTVTRPTAAMREAMAYADVDDDVIDFDPTVRRLQEAIAERLGKEAAMFMPSGTMTNQVAVRLHCKPGDEFICEEGCHIFQYEQGAFAQLSGLVARTVTGTHGLLDLEQISGLIRPDDEHAVQTRLLCLENTHNRAGGRVLPWEQIRRLCDWAHENGLKTHLDGARLFNAVVASGIDARTWASGFDTISVCFSKGLGAPVGSALVGPASMVREVRRHRKLFGGGMRQAGIIAAGALYALEHHVERLAEDHVHARLIADAIQATPGLELTTPHIDTNIFYFRVDPALARADVFVKRLDAEGVRMLALGQNAIRGVTHLDVDRANIERAIDVIQSVAASA